MAAELNVLMTVVEIRRQPVEELAGNTEQLIVQTFQQYFMDDSVEGGRMSNPTVRRAPLSDCSRQ